MAQYEIQLKDLVRIFKKRKGIIIFSAISLTLISALFAQVKSPTPLYEATSKVKYDKSQTLAGMIDSVFYWSPYDNITSQTKIITSFSVLEKAAKKIGAIDPDISSDDVLISKDLMGVISVLESQITAEPEANTNIINITVTATDPEEAAALANALAQSYRDYNIEETNKRTIDTKLFIENQLELVSERLELAEDNLREYQKEREIISLNSQALTDLEALSALEVEYETLGRENETLRFFKKNLSDDLTGSNNDFTVHELDIHSNLYSLNREIQTLLIERDTYLTTYTPRHPVIVELNREIGEIQGLMITDIESRISVNENRMEALSEDIDYYRDRASDYPDENLTLERLHREVELQSELYTELNSRYQEILIQESGKIEEVSIVAPALPPDMPINPPNIGSSLFVGLVLGIMLGAFFAVVLENLDTSIGTIEDVESYLELPVLGVIPYISLDRDSASPPDSKAGDDDRLKYPIVLNLPPKLPAVEAYRSLRTNILFANQEKDIKTIMITSSSLQEGKSINCINTAITLALGGYKTLLVEADLRRGVVGKVFGVDKSPGLSDIILGTQPWREVKRDFNDIILGSGFDMDLLIKSPDLSLLHFITSGVFPANPAELLNSQQMTNFLEEIKEEYDFIILDCTPVMPVTDAVLLSQKVDSVILLYEVGKIARGVLKRSKSHLDNVRAHIMGVVLNGVRPEYGPDYYEYHYQYYYSEEEMPQPLSEWDKIKDMWYRRREILTKENLSHLIGTAKDRASRLFSRRHDR